LPRSFALPDRARIEHRAGGQRRWDDARIDPKTIVHPPPSRIGAQPPGIPLDRDRFPGLQLLPVEQSEAKLEPLPTLWPLLRIKPIPIVWPRKAIVAAGDGAAPAARASAR
jgi:hypothetical protein